MGLAGPRHSGFVFTLLFASVAGCAPHTQSAPSSVPAPLVSALMDDRSSASPAAHRYAVGTLPAGYPARLVPSAPATIVGGMTNGDEIVAVFADSTRRLAAVMEQIFEQAGFTRPAPTPGAGFSSGSGPYSFFCSDSGMVSASPLTGEDRSFVRVSYRRRSASSCRMFERQTPSTTELALPELKPPADAHVYRSNGGSGRDGVRSSAEMTAPTLTPAAILAHYAAALVAAGWTTDTPAVSARVAAQFFEAKDASNAVWEGVLLVDGIGPNLSLSLTMHPRERR